MSVFKVSALTTLLLLPIISHAEGGGDRVIERYEQARNAQAALLNEDKKSIAERNNHGSEQAD